MTNPKLIDEDRGKPEESDVEETDQEVSYIGYQEREVQSDMVKKKKAKVVEETLNDHKEAQETTATVLRFKTKSLTGREINCLLLSLGGRYGYCWLDEELCL